MLQSRIQESGFKKNKVKVTGELKEQIQFKSKDDDNWYSLSNTH